LLCRKGFLGKAHRCHDPSIREKAAREQTALILMRSSTRAVAVKRADGSET